MLKFDFLIDNDKVLLSVYQPSVKEAIEAVIEFIGEYEMEKDFSLISIEKAE